MNVVFMQNGKKNENVINLNGEFDLKDLLKLADRGDNTENISDIFVNNIAKEDASNK
jgi:hypothetical protein